jgi:hypothetical protein
MTAAGFRVITGDASQGIQCQRGGRAWGNGAKIRPMRRYYTPPRAPQGCGARSRGEIGRQRKGNTTRRNRCATRMLTGRWPIKTCGQPQRVARRLPVVFHQTQPGTPSLATHPSLSKLYLYRGYVTRAVRYGIVRGVWPCIIGAARGGAGHEPGRCEPISVDLSH